MLADPVPQAQLLERLTPFMLTGQIYKKKGIAFLRPATAGETIATVLQGKEETTNTAQEGDMVVQANTSEKEQYILTQEKFLRVYETPGVEITDHPDSAELSANGYKAYNAKGRVLALEVTQGILEQHLPGGRFIASWGTPMVCEVGDFLCSPVLPGATPSAPLGEIYRIETGAFAQTYSLEG